MKTLGERIRELRDALDFSLREVARQLDISAAFLSDVELGRRYPSDELLVRIAELLQTTLDDLRQYDSRPPLDDLKRRSAAAPAYGFALRKIVETDIPPDELLDLINRHVSKRRDK